MKKCNITGLVLGGKFNYECDFKTKLDNFKSKNEGKKFEVEYKIIDTPEHFQHKYYRGYLLLDIMHNESEVDADYVHEFILKPKFLMKEIKVLKDIPGKHSKGCSLYSKKDKIYYAPSTANLTFEEMKDFILKCENYLSKIGGHLGDLSNKNDIEKIRSKAIDNGNN